MQNQNAFSVMQAEAPQVAQAFHGLIETVSSHVPMAKKEGATREEIRDTILMTLTVCGVQGLTHCLIPALEAYENC